ncbi:hypothetical protein [Micromonospora sp. WMMD980]|nr:hypothetical protein [Micromonospora sp. WMMD980]MDG4801756.1 hypothetical protein [Micromonospora sp. WMMD980]
MKLRIIRDFLGALADAVRPETPAAREIREREELKARLRTGQNGGVK